MISTRINSKERCTAPSGVNDRASLPLTSRSIVLSVSTNLTSTSLVEAVTKNELWPEMICSFLHFFN